MPFFFPQPQFFRTLLLFALTLLSHLPLYKLLPIPAEHNLPTPYTLLSFYTHFFSLTHTHCCDSTQSTTLHYLLLLTSYSKPTPHSLYNPPAPPSTPHHLSFSKHLALLHLLTAILVSYKLYSTLLAWLMSRCHDMIKTTSQAL